MDNRRCAGECADRECVTEPLARRVFVRQSLLVSVAALFADACRLEFPTNPLPTLASLGDNGYSIALTAYPALYKVGGIARVDVPGGIPVAVVRASDTAYEAFWMSCPHQGTTLDVHGTGFACPNHGARFDADGNWTGGQPAGHLTPVPIRYDASVGTIAIGLAPLDPPPVRKPMALDVIIASVPSLAVVGGIAIFGTGNGYPAALVRVEDATYLALSLICPHQAYYVETDETGRRFRCPGHGAEFTGSGIWTGGQSTTNLRVLSSTYDRARGVVTITIP